VRIHKEGGRLTPGDVRETLAYIASHRTFDEPFDVVVGGPLPGDDPARAAATAAEFADAGATWMIQAIGPGSGGPDVDGGRCRIRQGPPRI
jgi:hypothetical protein